MATAETLFSLFFLIGLGYLAKRTLLAGQSVAVLNSFVYYFAVPALLFSSATRLSPEQLLQPYFLGAFLGAALLTALVTVAGSLLLLADRDGPRMVIRGLNGTFSNYAYMGIPLVFGLLGEASHAATLIIILAGNLVLIGGVQLLLELLRPSGQATTGLRRGWQLLDRSLLRSPIFLATAAGVSVSALEWSLPVFLDSALLMLAPAAIPVALFCLGASLEFQQIKQNRLELGWLVVAKLLIHPLITLLTLKLAGIDDPNWLLPAVLLAALPTGALAHVVALRYASGEQQTALVIMLSTLLSGASLWLWISWLL